MKKSNKIILKKLIKEEIKKQNKPKDSKLTNEGAIFNFLVKLLAYKGLNKAKQMPEWDILSKHASDMKELGKIADDYKPLLDKTAKWMKLPSASDPTKTNGQILQMQIDKNNKIN